jgi:hypothetical protein
MVVQNTYRDAYFLFGSACRLLAGKIAVKDYKTTLEDLWQWSKRKVDELQDVPDFAPPNGAPVTIEPPKAEAPPPVVETSAVVDPPIVYLTAEQQQRFVSDCRKQGFTEEGVITFLKAHDITGTANIPLSQARVLWEKAKELEVIQQYR